ncbi:PREDICTED: uncharacterized protein LOC101315302 [Fragaria vesca subsp. vesca]|uniref:uncharacterized protein LOC101315302 n=1 Tax=Fragaria vesca subsp. vesca TaxID=101020 RepID=UPI0002C35F4D|nr:PREDICTED: uncharacterized protein LOC101315302 [Fragaria vesca subsp. vesca]
MASSLEQHGEIPYADESIIEAVPCCFEETVDVLDLNGGINMLGILVADEEPSLGGIKNGLMNMWKSLGQIRIIRAKKNTCSISVGSEKLASKLLDTSPWLIKGYCFSIRHWPRYHLIEEIESNRVSFWIEAHGIPLEQMTKNNGRKLGEMLGSVLDVEDPSVVGFRGYLRIRVDLDTWRPLTTFVPLPRSQISTTKIKLQYEGLKNFCHKFGRLGHSNTACSHRINPALSRWGIVYDRAPIAEPPCQPLNTQANFPSEYPQASTFGVFAGIRSLRSFRSPVIPRKNQLPRRFLNLAWDMSQGRTTAVRQSAEFGLDLVGGEA